MCYSVTLFLLLSTGDLRRPKRQPSLSQRKVPKNVGLCGSSRDQPKYPLRATSRSRSCTIIDGFPPQVRAVHVGRQEISVHQHPLRLSSGSETCHKNDGNVIRYPSIVRPSNVDLYRPFNPNPTRIASSRHNCWLAHYKISALAFI